MNYFILLLKIAKYIYIYINFLLKIYKICSYRINIVLCCLGCSLLSTFNNISKFDC